MHQHFCPDCEMWWDCDDLCDLDVTDPDNETEKICPTCYLERLDERVRDESKEG